MKKALFTSLFFALLLTACGGKSIDNKDSSAAASSDMEKTVRTVDTSPEESSNLWTFDKGTLTSTTGLPMVVDFSATWCPPCQQLKPVFEDLAEQNAGKVTMVSIDVDEYPEIASAFGVSSIPALFFIKSDGKVVKTLVGLRDKSEIESEIEKLAK